MRKQRKQPALAGLNQSEIDQIVQWLHSCSYAVVRDRIAKSRPEGFGLQLSSGPLQRLYEKAMTRLLKQNLCAQGLDPFRKLTSNCFDQRNRQIFLVPGPETRRYMKTSFQGGPGAAVCGKVAT